jgi:transposase|nr:hypothetical protein [uncultured Prevotella sp.]
MIEDNNSHLSSLRRKRLDHERYIRNRAERLVQAKIYRDGHKEEIKAKRRKKSYEHFLDINKEVLL